LIAYNVGDAFSFFSIAYRYHVFSGISIVWLRAMRSIIVAAVRCVRCATARSPFIDVTSGEDHRSRRLFLFLVERLFFPDGFNMAGIP